MSRVVDRTGKVYGRWEVIILAGLDRHDQALWLCRCECGTEKILRGCDLASGGSQSCGCLNKDVNTRHGQSRRGLRTKIYGVYAQMKNRCTNPKNRKYPRYGGRGIRICPEWQDFSVFSAWAHSNGYKTGLTIDRINNDGNYEPSNCQWLTRSGNSKKQWADKRIS